MFSDVRCSYKSVFWSLINSRTLRVKISKFQGIAFTWTGIDRKIYKLAYKIYIKIYIFTFTKISKKHCTYCYCWFSDYWLYIYYILLIYIQHLYLYIHTWFDNKNIQSVMKTVRYMLLTSIVISTIQQVPLQKNKPCLNQIKPRFYNF